MTNTAVRAGWILALIAVVQSLAALDLSVVNVALPAIRADLGVTAEQLPWIVHAYTLTFGGCLLLGGQLGDLLGRRTVLLSGLLVFAAASIVGGLAWNAGVLIGARAVQGLGAAVLTPLTLALVTTTFPEGRDRRPAC
jgi:MFS family permease